MKELIVDINGNTLVWSYFCIPILVVSILNLNHDIRISLTILSITLVVENT